MKKDKTMKMSLTRAICLKLSQKFEKSREGEISLSSKLCWSSQKVLAQAELYNEMLSLPNNNIERKEWGRERGRKGGKVATEPLWDCSPSLDKRRERRPQSSPDQSNSQI